MVQFVRRAAQALFAHDDNQFDFLIPLNSFDAQQSMFASEWEKELATKRGFSVFPAASRNLNSLEFGYYEVAGELAHSPELANFPHLPQFGETNFALFGRIPKSSGNSRVFQMALAFEFVRWWSIERELVEALDDVLAFVRNPIEVYFQTALLNSRLRRRYIRKQIGELKSSKY